MILHCDTVLMVVAGENAFGIRTGRFFQAPPSLVQPYRCTQHFPPSRVSVDRSAHTQADALEHLTLLRYGADLTPLPDAPVSHMERERLLRAERVALVAEEMEFSRHPRTISNYQRAHASFSAYLGSMFPSVDAGWRLCRPDDVCYYIRRHLLPTLTGRSGPTSDVASSTLFGLVSSLSQCFKSRGRAQDWCDIDAVGNPVRSDLVQTALRVYQRRHLMSGARPRSAVPIQLADLCLLVKNMDAALVLAAQAHDRARAGLLLRDLTHMLYMWCSGRRGQDALHVDWGDMYLLGIDGHPTPVAIA